MPLCPSPGGCCAVPSILVSRPARDRISRSVLQRKGAMNTYHVAPDRDDTASGASTDPLRTIDRAAQLARPGDEVIVHEGEYREWVRPLRGGRSSTRRITYAAATGERAVIKGSDRKSVVEGTRDRRCGRRHAKSKRDWSSADCSTDPTAPGASPDPLRTIDRAAQLARPGDEVIVHEGEYREWVRPLRGGRSSTRRITYAAATGERVVIKG